MTAPLELVTFEDLVERITEFKENARAEDSIAGWAKLLDVASDMAGSDTADDDITAGRTWHLTHVRVSGYQGIGESDPLEISFPPRPGITVVHGPNGLGKSSIADAIETGLQGRTPAPTLQGSGGNTPVWERVHLGRDADEAVIELTLQTGGESLEICCAVGSADETVRYGATHRSGSSGGAIDLTATRWSSAVAGHRPVYAYAAVERQVQLAKDLQHFLEGLLAFGFCFDTLESEVGRRSEDVFRAKRKWDTALSAATQKVQTLDTTWAGDGQTPLRELVRPAVDEDPDEWLEREGLMETGHALPEVTAEHLDRLREMARELDEQVAKLHDAETSLHAQLAGPLTELHKEATRLEDSGNVCPVCDTADIGWLERLGTSVDGLVGLASIQQSYRAAASRLREAAEQALGGVREVIAARDGDEANLGWWDGTVRPFFDTERSAGHHVTADLRSAAATLSSWLSSLHCEQLVSEAATESDRLRQWRRGRRAAVEEFVCTWRSVATEARESPAWTSAKQRLTHLRNDLRRSRADTLSARTNTGVQNLLADAGIELKGITVQDRQASLEVADQHGERLKPAMLSAGQRNALLLAPMLAVSGAGPFGFVVLDDPVHAFDQVRVDRLAAAIAGLAQTKRVIVLTHDERLKEHLIAQQPECDVRGVKRDPASGAVESATEQQIWNSLLKDARGLVEATEKQRGGVTRPPHDIVRGLCRQAFDNALRSLVIRAAVADERSPEPDLAKLDEQYKTEERVTAVRRLLPNGSPHVALLDDAKAKVDPYLRGWNRAVHGNESADAPDLVSLGAEIDAAEQACQTLTGAPQ
jgi:predicted ATPase